MDHLVSEESLLEWLGYSRRADAMRWLEEHGISYWLGKGGRICTTQAAVDAAIVAETIARRDRAAKRSRMREDEISFV